MSLKNQKILLTGGAGYIGSHTAVELLNQGALVYVLDDLSNSSQESLKRVQEITEKKIHFTQLDLCDKKKLDEFFEQHNRQPFDCCIHFAGLKAVGESVKDPLSYYRNNIFSTLNLLDCLRLNGCFSFVFSSSATVYGRPKKLPLTETSPTSCTNPYGRTKLFIEKILTDLSVSDKRWRTAILRYFNPIGAHSSGKIGEDPQGLPNNLFPYLCQVAVGRREKLSVFGADYPTIDGTGVRDYIHVVDLAQGHLAAITNGLEDKKKSCLQIYNLGTGQGTSVLQMIEMMEVASDKKITYSVTERRPGDAASCYSCVDKARKELNWTAQLSIQQAVEDGWRWQRLNPSGYKR